ncbi:MAG: polysaccharide biosynthesis/export family protein [bacterium]
MKRFFSVFVPLVLTLSASAALGQGPAGLPPGDPILADALDGRASEHMLPALPMAVPGDYVIGIGDELEIFVWRNDQLSRQVTVMPDGRISIPLVQYVQAEGLTVQDLKDRIAEALSPYLENPKVTVIVRATHSCRVSVLGRVVRPGVYPITGSTTLIEAISMAGGLTEWAKKRKITLITQRGGSKESLRVNYNEIVSGEDLSRNFVLKRGDTIVVP